MVTLYSAPGEYLPINEAKEHLCGYYNQRRECINAEILVDTGSGHHVCSSCSRVTAKSGLRLCETCDCQFIDTSKYLDPKYEIYCPRCVTKYGF